MLQSLRTLAVRRERWNLVRAYPLYLRWATSLLLILVIGNTINFIYSALKPSRKYAAFYTPFSLSTGGGEKVLLTALLSYQQLGYHCLLFLEPSQTCITITCIQLTAERVQVEGIEWDRVSVILGARRNRYISTWYDIDVYFELGNNKYPQNYALGKIHNVYHCQFPFDLDQKLSPRLMKILASFDLVHVSSKFVHEWYMKCTLPEIIRYEGSGWKLPSVRIVPSPIGGKRMEAVTATSMKLLDDKTHSPDKFNIVMLGRIFIARQNKGYHVAIPTFHRLIKVDGGRHDLHLHIIGGMSQNNASQSYLSALQKNAAGLPITFHIGVSETDLDALMRNGTIFWHMTGIDQPKVNFDPASLEHFGIANLQGMAYGMIPIVPDRGGPAEATEHGVNGFLAATPDDYIKFSLNIIEMDPSMRKRMQRRAVEASLQYSSNFFIAKYTTLIKRGVMGSLYKGYQYHFARSGIPFSLPTLLPRSDKTAVIVEGTVDYSFDFSVRNTMQFLGEGWALQVHHSKLNRDFVHYILRDIPGVSFFESDVLDNIDGYNKLLKSPEFWKSLNSSKVLLFQSDAILLSESIMNYFFYDFIGAPSNICNREKIEEMPYLGRTKSVDHGCCSDGFSIRNVSLMERIASRYGSGSPSAESEAIFFFRNVLEHENPSLPSHKVAFEFCREVQLAVYPPFAVHKTLHSPRNYFDCYTLDKPFSQCMILQRLHKFFLSRKRSTMMEYLLL